MKKLLFLIPALIFTVSCQNDDDEFYTTSKSSESKVESVFQRGNFEADYYQETQMTEKGKDSIPDKDLLPWRGTPMNGGGANNGE